MTPANKSSGKRRRNSDSSDALSSTKISNTGRNATTSSQEPSRPANKHHKAAAASSSTASSSTASSSTASSSTASSAAASSAAASSAAASPAATSSAAAGTSAAGVSRGDSAQPPGDDPTANDADEPVAAVAARVTLASKGPLPRIGEKRAAFLEKYNGKTPEQILDALSKKWRSDVYKHFMKPKIIQTPQGGVVHRFVCQKYPSKHVDRADYEELTGNLTRHRGLCDPDDSPEVEMITAYARGTAYSPARELMCMLYAKVELPSRVTVSRDVQMIMLDGKIRVIAFLSSLPCKIHICVDGWTSPNIMSFLGVTAHWHRDGEIEHIILDFIRLTNGHTGKYLAEKLVECLTGYGIEKKVLAVTVDNADNNTTMLKEMHTLVKELRGPMARVRCFGHVLNLVVKAIMSMFLRKPKAKADAGVQAGHDDEDADLAALDDPEDVDEDDLEAAQEADQAREDADDALLDDMANNNVDVALTAQDIKEGRLAVEKVTKLSKKVWNSPPVRAALATLTHDAPDIHSEVLVHSVATRWNTVAAVIERALELQEVLGDLCDMAQFNKPRGVRLRRFILTDDDWMLLDQLHRLLDPFVYSTNEISHSSRGLVHEVIPFMDLLTEHVDEFIADDTLHPAVRGAAKRGRAILDKYYTLTDTTIVYRIAMMLHPRYKTQYFKDQSWPEDWITEARAIIEKEWTSNYKPKDAPAPADIPAVPAPSASRPGPGRRSAAASAASVSTRKRFAAIGGAAKAGCVDALKKYLEEPPAETVTDPLKYWDLVLKSSSESSGEHALARMAIDFLSAPAILTDAERAFSRSRLTVSRLRHSLADESVRANTVLGSWARIADLLPEADLVEVIRQHSAGKKRTVDVAQPALNSAKAGGDVIELD
ncbi:hypothetical protein TRAPUB_554 [Trametes pubescens]|uniref:HAT C-terminal dimerisation domain-containing protein n=1 Tax=Trametes pubescens TaxID=154538 RepID=A0A1M2VLU7_TRAPU|nr:hypothetical protein TRAPUB_554 [Trametes pubescens]